MAKRKKSDVPRELERAGELCLAFVNTAAPRIDRQPRPVDALLAALGC